MTRYLRPIIMSALLALTFAVAACSSGPGSSSDDQRNKSDSSSPFGSGDGGSE